MSQKVIFDLQCQASTPEDFAEITELCNDMYEHYATHCPKHDYMISIKNSPDGGYVAMGVRVNRMDWRVSFSRPNTPESERKDE